jgi:hypothetical protein
MYINKTQNSISKTQNLELTFNLILSEQLAGGNRGKVNWFSIGG